MVDGFAISKQSMSCGNWEAVPTMAGKDPRLSSPKRAKKNPIINQEVRDSLDMSIFSSTDTIAALPSLLGWRRSDSLLWLPTFLSL